MPIMCKPLTKVSSPSSKPLRPWTSPGALAVPAAERNRAAMHRLAQSEGELAWLTYIIGQVLGCHLTPRAHPSPKLTLTLSWEITWGFY